MALGTEDVGAKGSFGSLINTVLKDKCEQKDESLGISKKGEEKVETSFLKKALKFRQCFAVSSSFYLVKTIPVQQDPLRLTFCFRGKKRHAELGRTSRVNDSRHFCLSRQVAFE